MGLLSGQLTQRSGASEGPRAPLSPLESAVRWALGAGRLEMEMEMPDALRITFHIAMR